MLGCWEEPPARLTRALTEYPGDHVSDSMGLPWDINLSSIDLSLLSVFRSYPREGMGLF